MKTKGLFLPTEKATANELINFKDNVEKFSYEYLVVYSLANKFQIIDSELMRKSYKYLVKRHPNMKAYYDINENGAIERFYSIKEEVDVNVYFDNINCTSDSELLKDYIKSIRKIDSLHRIANQNYYFVKTIDNYVIISYSHHAFKDAYIDNVLLEEMFSIYHELKKDPQATYEKSTIHLPQIYEYSKVLTNFYESNQKKLYDLVQYLKNKYLHYELFKEYLISPLNKNTELCKAEKIRIVLNQTQDTTCEMKLKDIKTNQLILTLSQIALHKVFQIKGIIPLWKLNGSRPNIAKGVLCSYIKDQVFIQPLIENNTLLRQYEQNYNNQKENLIKFNDCDYSQALEILTDTLGFDCFPKVCFNNYQFNTNIKNVIASKLLTDEYDVVNSNMNIYFDFSLDLLTKVYSLTIFYKKHLFDHDTISQIIDFIYLGYKHIDKIIDLKIQDIGLNYLKNLEKTGDFKKQLNAKF